MHQASARSLLVFLPINQVRVSSILHSSHRQSRLLYTWGDLTQQGILLPSYSLVKTGFRLWQFLRRYSIHPKYLRQFLYLFAFVSIKSSFKGHFDDFAHHLDLIISLGVRNWGEVLANAQPFTKFDGVCILKLFGIIRNKEEGHTKPTNNVISNKIWYI